MRGKHRELLNIGNYVSKGIRQREEVLKYDYIKILHFYTNKDTISKGKIQAADWKKILVSNILNENLYFWFLQISKKDNPRKMDK